MTGSEHLICEFQKQHELDYVAKTADVLKQVADRRKDMNEKNVRTTLDTTPDDIQEARDDNGCDDAEELWVVCCSRNARRGGHPRMLRVIL